MFRQVQGRDFGPGGSLLPGSKDTSRAFRVGGKVEKSTFGSRPARFCFFQIVGSRPSLVLFLRLFR